MNISLLHRLSCVVFFALLTCALGACSSSPDASEPTTLNKSDDPVTPNPVIPGEFADPDILYVDGTLYIYATGDGGQAQREEFGELGCWSTDDGETWTRHKLNWPTRAQCQSDTGTDYGIWAPGVIAWPDGTYRMYVSIGSEIWVGEADHPLGPWRNAMGEDVPMIRHEEGSPVHVIDAAVYIDDDQTIYLMYGSGWEFVNGRFMIGTVEQDGVTWIDEPTDHTKANYFEAPYMFKHEGTYYLMYSNGIFSDDNYRLHYATADDPMGPWTEASNSPVMTSRPELGIYGPGHNSVLQIDDTWLCFYHRHRKPFDPDQDPRASAHRVLCIDEITFDQDGLLHVDATDEGVNLPALMD